MPLPRFFRSEESLRPKKIAALCVLSAKFAISANAYAQEHVLSGNARFEVLSPSVLRMEYSRGRKFLDRHSVAVVNRKWGPVEYHTVNSGEWLEISTTKLTLRYRARSREFTRDNLLISWSDEDGEHRSEPGEKDDKNLGGDPGDIALRTTPGEEPGPVSRNGYFFLDDSHTADLLGCHLDAEAQRSPSPPVIARLDCDRASAPHATVRYEIHFPKANAPGGGGARRSVDGHGFIHFERPAPFSLKPGPHSIRVRVIFEWTGRQTEVTRDVEWRNQG
jgi:hypothetical protein